MANTFKQFLEKQKSREAYHVKDSRGELLAVWKTDLQSEEDDSYLPTGYDYNKVLDLSMITANDPNKGHGTELMKEFLNSPVAKSAELIFLDLSPFQGVNADGKKSEEDILDSLARFYRRFGFKNRRKHSRMWLVQKGHIPENELPT